MTQILRITIVTGLLLMNYSVSAEECRDYTVEQRKILDLAYSVGYDYDLGVTLAAISKQESFVGSYVIRDNPNDYSVHYDAEGRETKIRGSYGITHILLSTAMWLEEEDSLWGARGKIASKLMTDDVYALRMAIKKLESVKREGQTWREMVARYNGSGIMARQYAEKIASHVNEFKRCEVFN